MKKRAPSNRIGHRGESEFRAFASRNGLMTTKIEEDFGLDFICQVDENPGSRAPSRISGTVVGAAVRSTETSDGRVTLDRKDAEALLRAAFPVCFILVHFTNEGPAFHHRSIDAQFGDELSDFLESRRQTFSMTPRQCRGESEFRSDVMAALRPGADEQWRIELAQRRIGKQMTDVSLEVQRDADGGLTAVTALNFYDYFEQLEDSDRRRLYVATFGRPALQTERLAVLAVRRDLLNELEGLPRPFVLRGFTPFSVAKLTVTLEDEHTTCRFIYTSNGHHSGYIHPAGFALTVSDRKLVDDQWVHELAAFADPDAELDLTEHQELSGFLQMCRPGAQIHVEGGVFEAESFRDLPLYAAFAVYVTKTSTLPGWEAENVRLAEGVDEETLNSLGWLAALVDNPSAAASLAFVLETRNAPQPDEEAACWTMPALCNTGGKSIVAWLRCDGDLLIAAGEVRGLRTRRVLGVRLETLPRIDKPSRFPEVLLDPSVPHMVATPNGWRTAERSAKIPNQLALAVERSSPSPG